MPSVRPKYLFFINLVVFVLFSKIIRSSDLEKLTDRKWVLTETHYAGMGKDDLSHRQYFLIFHSNFEMTYRLDSNPGKIQIESMAGNALLYKYIKSDEQTYNGKVAEKVYQLLIKAQQYSLRDDTLELFSEFGFIRFLAIPFRDSGLTGTWTLTGYTNPGSETQVKIPEKLKRQVKLHFNDDGSEGTTSGFTEENEINGKYELPDTNHIKFTKINNPLKQEKNDWNEKFWEVIKFTSSYEVRNDTLHIYYYEDKEYMEFQREDEEK